MFSCVKPKDMVAQNNDLSSSSAHTVSMDMQELLNIAMSLKKKCKSLRSLLLETENKRAEEQRGYQQQYSELHTRYEDKISELNTQYMLDTSQLKDYKAFEVDDLRKVCVCVCVCVRPILSVMSLHTVYDRYFIISHRYMQ